MKYRLAQWWDALRTNFWFLPLVMGVGGMLLAGWTGRMDRVGWPPGLRDADLLLHTGPAGARAILSTVAASAITVAGVIFSLTLVSLSLAASQLGPRLLRNFLKRGGTQFVVGTFMATFVFCLLALRLVDDGATPGEVPVLTVLVGMLLGILSFGVLLFHIHRMVQFVQAPRVLASVSDELRDTIERTLPDPQAAGRGQADAAWAPLDPDTSVHIQARRTGYVQVLSYAAIAEVARTHGRRVQLRVRPGHFAAEGDALAWMTPGAGRDGVVAEAVRDAITLGQRRTHAQDVEHGFRQLVEVAVRALSPGVNDPFTAMNAVDRLGAALGLAARRSLPDPVVADENGVTRVHTVEHTWAGMVGAAYDQVRQHARRDQAVSIRILESLARVAERDGLPMSLRVALGEQARRVLVGIESEPGAAWIEADLAVARDAHDRVRALTDR